MIALHADGTVQLFDDESPHGEHWLVMTKVYLDRGLKRDATDGVVTVAAAVFKPVPYKRFVRPWNRMLSGWKAFAFHATDFYPGGGEFKRDTPGLRERFERDSRLIPQLIGENATRLIAIGFRPDEYLAVASPEFKASYGLSLHSMAVQIVLIVLGWWAKEVSYHGGFACFMESGDDDETEVVETVHNMKRDAVTGPHVQVKSFTTVDKGRARGLEAADCLAWHWNKYYMDKFRLGKEDDARKDFAAMMHAAEDKMYLSLIVGDKLKHLLSRAPVAAPSGTQISERQAVERAPR
jgi:hypothetical protein